MGRLSYWRGFVAWGLIYTAALGPVFTPLADAAPGDEAEVALPQQPLQQGDLPAATPADIAISVNGRLNPAVDDPRAIEVSNMIQMGQVTPINLDFIAGQRIRVPSTGQNFSPSTNPTFDIPVPSSSNVKDVRVITEGDHLVFQIGNVPPQSAQFQPVLEHVVNSVRVAGEEGKQFANTSANIYLVNRQAGGALDALRAVSIPQLEGTAKQRGALFKHNFFVSHTIPLQHLPKDWTYVGISLLARNQVPRELLRIDNLQPVSADFEKGGEDICLTFKDNTGTERYLWVPQEIANQRQLRRMEQLAWLSLLDNGGLDQVERQQVKDFLGAMAEESSAIEEARTELKEFTQKRSRNLKHSDLALRALRATNLPWLMAYLAPVEEEVRTLEGEALTIKRSRLGKLYNEQRDRFGSNWAADYERIQRVRAGRKEGTTVSKPNETATHAWAGELREAVSEEQQLLSTFEVAAEYRKDALRKTFVERVLDNRRILFLTTALSAVTAVALLPEGNAPVEFLAAVGSQIIHAAEKTPFEMLIKPITEFGNMAGTAYNTGHWGKFALLSGGFAVCVAQYFLGHLIAGSIASAAGKTGEFYTRSTNQMWEFYCKCIRPWTMPETLNRWIFNAGRTDKLITARSPENVAELDASLAKRKSAEVTGTTLATLVASARFETEGQGEAAQRKIVEKMMTHIAAVAAVAEKMNVSPDLLLALNAFAMGPDAGPARELTLAEVRAETEAMMSDPARYEQLIATRAVIVRALMAMADSKDAIPIDEQLLKAETAWFEKVAAHVTKAELTPKSRGLVKDAVTGFLQMTSKDLFTFREFMSQLVTGTTGAEVARSAGKPVPPHIRDEAIRRAVTDFLISEFNGALLEPKLFMLPTSVKETPGFVPALAGSWEQTFAWLMIPIGNMMLTMARPETLKNSAVPFESTGLEATEARQQTLESYMLKMFQNTYNPDPSSPGFFANVFSYIKSGVVQHKVRCGFLALCLLAGYMVQKFTGTPDIAAKINLWTIPLVSWILAYNISWAKACISPSHVGYAMGWPGVDLSDVNTRWIEKNKARIEKALGELGSSDLALRRAGAREMKRLYSEEGGSIPDRFNKPVAEFSAQDFTDFYGHSLKFLPKPTKESQLGGDLLNVAGVTSTTIIYFGVFKGVFSDVPSLKEVSWDFVYMTSWMGATALGALYMDRASRWVAKVAEPVTSRIEVVASAFVSTCRLVASHLGGPAVPKSINLD